MNYPDAKKLEGNQIDYFPSRHELRVIERSFALGWLDCHAQAEKLAAALDAVVKGYLEIGPVFDWGSWYEDAKGVLDSWRLETGVTKQKGGENENS